MEINKVDKKQIGKFLILMIFVFLIGLTSYLIFLQIDKSTKIIFCNVGQGDAAYIRIENKTDVLIDAGPNKDVLSCLGKYMPFWDKEIELAFLSHSNKDHYQGFYYINERYKIKNFITTESPFVTNTYKQLINNLINKKTKIYYYFQREKINIGKNNQFIFFWPNKNLVSSDDNDYSQIMIFKNNNFKILFTGDATSKILNNILADNNFLNNKINIIKIPHHGSKYGINKKFLEVIRPDIAVISVGKNNSYGHPAKEVLNLLKALNIKIKRTDINGDIKFTLKESL
ncbi:MAG: metallo beta-lactamase superfamily lipoprotein [Patescibacteria group bacterium]|nr:MAG: metallo beta-lactamase superfamily lipoprotein [Patescibacteria group bacterium]